MNRLRTGEKQRVKQFMQLTNCSEKIALNCLAQNEWRLEVACDSFFTNPEIYTKITADRKKIENWFHKYSQNTDKIQIDGCIQLLNDLNLQPNDRKVLILAHKLRAQTQCEFTKQEFVLGMSEINCDSNQTLYQRLIEFETEITKETNKLKDLYLYAWNYGKHPEAKTMEWETAIQYWNILLHNIFDPQLLQLWISFVADNGKAVTKDTWNLLFEFFTSVDKTLSNYDFDGAWPTMIDEFVTQARERLKQHNNHAIK